MKDRLKEWLSTTQGALTVLVTLLALVTTWWNLGLPRLVLSTELSFLTTRMDKLERLNSDTRILVLDQAWWRVRHQLENLELEFGDGPEPDHVRELRRNLEQQLHQLERQMAILRRDDP